MRCSASGAIKIGSATSVPRTVVAVVTVADVDEYARAKLAPLERGEVVPERDLVARAAGEVRVRVGVELVLREPLVVPDVERARPRRETAPEKTKPASGAADGFQMPGYEGGAGKLDFRAGFGSFLPLKGEIRKACRLSCEAAEKWPSG